PNSTNNSPVYELYTPVKIDPSNTLLYGVRDINLSHSSLYNASIYDYMPPKSIGKFKLLSGLSTEPITHNNNNSPIDSNVISGGISSSYIDWLFQSKLIFNSLIFNPVTEYRGSSITLGNQFRLSVPIYSYKGKGFSSQDSLISTIIEFK
ncbi:MAG: hypothetical protein RSA01_05220, partial [Clostridium sp.]